VTHAQPHWHVYGSRLEAIAQESPSVPVNPEGVRRMHLAASARWHEDVHSPNYVHLGPHNLEGWVKGSLNYLGSQLVYLSRHRSA